MSESVANPFQSPGEVHEPADLPRRSPWLAGLLAAGLGVIGLVYCGRLGRALGWQLFFYLSLFPVGYALLYLSNGRLALVLAAIFILVPWLVMVIDSVWIARRAKSAPRKSYQSWWGYLLIYILIALLGNGATYLIRSTWCQAFVVPTNGMAPTVKAGDQILVEMTGPSSQALRRGAIVAYISRDTGTELEQICLARIIGLPGDTVEIIDEQVYVNQEPLEEPYSVRASLSERREFQHWQPELFDLEAQQIPAEYVFLLGDNRPNSMDSRMRGSTSTDDIVGIARLIYLSTDRRSPSEIHSNKNVNADGSIRWERVGRRLDSQMVP